MKTNIKQFTNNIDISNDIESLPQIEINTDEVKFNDDIDDDITDDYKYSREKLMYAMSAIEAVMKHAITDMSNNPGPRPVEAFSSLIKTLNETSDRIFSLHEKMKKINPKKEEIIESDTNDAPKKIKATINDIIDGMEDK